jgi:hypothetical protein
MKPRVLGVGVVSMLATASRIEKLGDDSR